MAKINTSHSVNDPRYTAIREASAAAKENNDCSVVAIAAACDISYDDAHKAMKAEGRKDRQGALTSDILKAVKAVGFKAKKVDPQKFIKQYPGVHSTLKGVTTHHMDRFPKAWDDGKTYLLFTKRHIGAVVAGVNIDWTKGSSKRAVAIYEVTK
jgi:hypothetical protein